MKNQDGAAPVILRPEGPKNLPSRDNQSRSLAALGMTTGGEELGMTGPLSFRGAKRRRICPVAAGPEQILRCAQDDKN